MAPAEGSKVPKFIAIAVITIDLLLFYVILSLFSVKKKAVAIANEISSEINSQNKELNLKQEELIKAKYIAEISQKRVQTILDNTVDGITSIDEKGQIVTFNQACEKLFQYKVEEVIGKNVNILMPEPYHSKHDDYLKRYLDTGEAKIIGIDIGIGREVIGLRKDGSTFPMDLSISAFMDGDEQTFIGIVRDITERKNSQNKLEKMVGELTVSNTDLERFAYVASHDLQEPIRMVTNFTQLLKEEYSDKLDDDGHTYIKFAHEAAIRMHNLIAGLLEYSKLSGDRPELTPVDLNNTLNVVKENLMQKIADNKAAITNENLPTIIIDEIQAVQLFQNLIANAINYQKAGNTPIINISVIESANKWEIRIADNGIGIDEKYFEQIFSPFNRLHSHAEYQGTGIGLSVCKKIVENAGGSLSLTSVKGDGTTFTILLPKTFTPIEDLK